MAPHSLPFRRQFMLLWILVCVSASCFSQSRYQYRVEKVSQDIYVLEPMINDYRWVTSNIVVVINDSDVFVVDSGLLPSAAAEAIREIRKLTAKPVRYLLNTHWHGDHWQGNEVFQKEYPGIRIIASEKNKEAIGRNGMLWVNTLYPRYLNQMLDSYVEKLARDTSGQLNQAAKDSLRQGIEETRADIVELKALHPVFPNTTFSEKMTIQTGHRIIELHYLGVGNTVGDAIAFLPQEKVLITGDLVVFPSPYESGAFSTEWVETSRKLQEMFPYENLIPGHGTVQHDGSYLSYLNALFQEIIKQVNDAYLDGTNRMDDFIKIVTTASVTQILNQNPSFRKYTAVLDPGFVPASVRNIYRAVINKGLPPDTNH